MATRAWVLGSSGQKHGIDIVQTLAIGGWQHGPRSEVRRAQSSPLESLLITGISNGQTAYPGSHDTHATYL